MLFTSPMYFKDWNHLAYAYLNLNKLNMIKNRDVGLLISKTYFYQHLRQTILRIQIHTFI